MEANAFLIRKAGDVDVKRQRDLRAREFLAGGQREQNAERTIVAPRIANRVEMRSEQQRLCPGIGARETADDIAPGVARDMEARLTHPLLDPIVGALHRGRKKSSCQRIGFVADFAQLQKAIDHRGGGVGRRLHGEFSFRGRSSTPTARRGEGTW